MGGTTVINHGGQNTGTKFIYSRSGVGAGQTGGESIYPNTSYPEDDDIDGIEEEKKVE